MAEALVMEQLIQHRPGVGLVTTVAQYLLFEKIARILLQQSGQIRVDHWIRRGAGDVDGDSIGSRGVDGLTYKAATSAQTTQGLTGYTGGGVELGQHLKVKSTARRNGSGAGGRA